MLNRFKAGLFASFDCVGGVPVLAPPKLPNSDVFGAESCAGAVALVDAGVADEDWAFPNGLLAD